MEGFPQRRKNRLRAELYRGSGVYFITICTRDKENLFWRTGDDSVGAALRRPPDPLNARGEQVRDAIVRLEEVYRGAVAL